MSWKRWAGVWFVVYVLVSAIYQPEQMCVSYETTTGASGVPEIGNCVEYMTVGPSSATVGITAATPLTIVGFAISKIVPGSTIETARNWPYWPEYIVLTALAGAVQILFSPDPLSAIDFLLTPVTGAIWLAIGWLLWTGYRRLNRWRRAEER